MGGGRGGEGGEGRKFLLVPFKCIAYRHNHEAFVIYIDMIMMLKVS